MGAHNDYCDRGRGCGRQPYYGGHEPWCDAIADLEERFQQLAAGFGVSAQDVAQAAVDITRAPADAPGPDAAVSAAPRLSIEPNRA